jgi:hypothetical protein
VSDVIAFNGRDQRAVAEVLERAGLALEYQQIFVDNEVSPRPQRTRAKAKGRKKKKKNGKKIVFFFRFFSLCLCFVCGADGVFLRLLHRARRSAAARTHSRTTICRCGVCVFVVFFLLGSKIFFFFSPL